VTQNAGSNPEVRHFMSKFLRKLV